MDAALGLRRRVSIAAAAVGAAVATVVAPPRQRERHLDHHAFEATVRRMQDGVGFYEAFVDGMSTIGARMSEPRAFREPLPFWLWAALPGGVLQAAFFVLVVFASAGLAALISRTPEVGLAVGAYLALVAVFNGVDAWLLSELWAVPLVLLACVAWLRDADWLAAAAATAAVLVREPAVLVPLGFLVGSRAARRPLVPWVASLAAGTVGIWVHWLVAEEHLVPEGNSPPLIGTGSASAVVEMTSFLAWPGAAGLLLWVAGCIALWRTPLRAQLPLALLPLLGLLIRRQYWGFLAVPLWLVALGGVDRVRDRRGAPCRTPLRQPRRAAMTGP